MSGQPLTYEEILNLIRQEVRAEVRRVMKEQDDEYIKPQQETERQRRATIRRRERIEKSIREVIGFTGPFIDDMLDNGIIEDFQALGYNVSDSVRRDHSLENMEMRIRGEFGLTLVGTDVIILIKVEETLETKDIREHIGKITEYCRHLASVGFVKPRHTHLLPIDTLFRSCCGGIC
ncbi:MAG: hypothetical protein FWC43_01145 [Planctomycetaceae bacterium]|nr:hypothetical protein [Planctomycetaceae bacterium]